jgi:hypothetical protein
MISTTQINLSGTHIGNKNPKTGNMSNRHLNEVVSLERNDDGFYERECRRCGATYEDRSPIGPRDCTHDVRSSVPCALPWEIAGAIAGEVE